MSLGSEVKSYEQVRFLYVNYRDNAGRLEALSDGGNWQKVNQGQLHEYKEFLEKAIEYYGAEGNKGKVELYQSYLQNLEDVIVH